MRNQEKYDGQFKKNVVEYMYENKLSLLETAIHFSLFGNGIVKKWERIYYKERVTALHTLTVIFAPHHIESALQNHNF